MPAVLPSTRPAVDDPQGTMGTVAYVRRRRAARDAVQRGGGEKASDEAIGRGNTVACQLVWFAPGRGRRD
jgi:hypothetical protein